MSSTQYCVFCTQCTVHNVAVCKQVLLVSSTQYCVFCTQCTVHNATVCGKVLLVSFTYYCVCCTQCTVHNVAVCRQLLLVSAILLTVLPSIQNPVDTAWPHRAVMCWVYWGLLCDIKEVQLPTSALFAACTPLTLYLPITPLYPQNQRASLHLAYISIRILLNVYCSLNQLNRKCHGFKSYKLTSSISVCTLKLFATHLLLSSLMLHNPDIAPFL